MTIIIKKIIYLFFGLGYISILSQTTPINNTPSSETQQDCKTLIEIYKHFKLKLPPFANDNNQNCCSYEARLAASKVSAYGTTDWMCDSSNSRINTIILQGRNIDTDVPWDLFQKLDKLEVLHLYDNKLTGEIKGDLRETFPNLQQLRLQNNNLSGYLPTYLPPKLETLVFTGNNKINDSIPKEWQEGSSLKDCVLPKSICNPRSSKLDCYTNSNSNESSVVTSCQNDIQEDRTAALQKLNSNNNNSNNNNTNNNNDINNNNNDNNTNNNNNNLNNNQQDDISNGNKIGGKKKKRSQAVLIMTGSIVSLMFSLLIVISLVSHFSRKRIREKEKDIYKGTIYDESNSNSRTEASIFYSRTNSNESSNLMSFDDGINNSISLFNCMNHRNSQNSQTTVEHKLLNGSPIDDEISFIENTNHNNMSSVEMSFSVIDPSQEIIEPAPVLVKSSDTSYI